MDDPRHAVAARAHGFAPILGPAPRVLLLGSLPGTASLRAGEYYAQPRNAFWPILAALTGVAATADYPARCAGLVQAGLAVWDVCRSAVRPGSLDAAIVAVTVDAQPLAALIGAQPTLRAIAFNGRAAATLFERHIALHGLPGADLPRLLLPSTSAAHATLPVAAKAQHWQDALGPYLSP